MEFELDRKALRRAIDVWKKVGLFENKTTDEVLDLYEKKVVDSYDLYGYEPPDLHFQRIEDIPRMSETGIWWTDPECVYGNNEYSELVWECARISKGSFNPTGIDEWWDEDDSPMSPPKITIEFLANKKLHQFHPAVRSDWMDLEMMLFWINESCMVDADRKFEAFVDCNAAAILCLTAEEKSLLEKELNFPFFNLSACENYTPQPPPDDSWFLEPIKKDLAELGFTLDESLNVPGLIMGQHNFEWLIDQEKRTTLTLFRAFHEAWLYVDPKVTVADHRVSNLVIKSIGKMKPFQTIDDFEVPLRAFVESLKRMIDYVAEFNQNLVGASDATQFDRLRSDFIDEVRGKVQPFVKRVFDGSFTKADIELLKVGKDSRYTLPAALIVAGRVDEARAMIEDYIRSHPNDLVYKQFCNRLLPENDAADREELSRIIEIYRSAGMFDRVSTRDVLDRYQEYVDYELDGKPGGKKQRLMDIARLSDTAIWWGQLDSSNRKDSYSRVISAWANISQGAFRPDSVTESWEHVPGPILIELQISGKAVKYSAPYLGGSVDIRILSWLNSLIAEEERQFAASVGEEGVAVLCLTPEEKLLFIDELDFPFTTVG